MSTEDLVRKISGALEGVAAEASPGRGNLVEIKSGPQDLAEAAIRLRNIGFDHVKAVTGVDHPEEGRIEVVYHISSLADLNLAKMIVILRTSVSKSSPSLPSLVDVWASALYLERETNDLLGVVFKGHPRLEKLLLPEEYEGLPPLLKEFEIKTEGVEA